MEIKNKRILINTIYLYAKMFFSTIITLIVTRYVLLKLGQSDFGLYSVVGGIVTMLNLVAVGMHTTTRRYINFEIGKEENSNPNKVFNICLVIHFGFAVLMFIIATTIGVWYINNYLNVDEGKLADSFFVYFTSTAVSALGIINIPYQGLMAAMERFREMTIIDLFSSFLKIPMVFLLLNWDGNSLRFYAVMICLITLTSLLLYQGFCMKNYREITRFHLYKDKSLYKEILTFNNYTSLGAAAYISRNQGSSLLINLFFGTIVNGAYAIAAQIENYIVMFVNNLTTASDPQITQLYAEHDFKKSFMLVERVSRYSILLMLSIIVVLFVELEYLLTLWLGKVPEGALILCQCVLLSIFVRSINSGCSSLIQATGKVRWFQIVGSILLIMSLPISFVLYRIGYPPVIIIIVFCITDFIRQMYYLFLLWKLVNFDTKGYMLRVYYPSLKVIVSILVYLFLYSKFIILEGASKFIGIGVTIVVMLLLCYMFGLKANERESLLDYIKKVPQRMPKHKE